MELGCSTCPRSAKKSKKARRVSSLVTGGGRCGMLVRTVVSGILPEAGGRSAERRADWDGVVRLEQRLLDQPRLGGPVQAWLVAAGHVQRDMVEPGAGQASGHVLPGAPDCVVDL